MPSKHRRACRDRTGQADALRRGETTMRILITGAAGFIGHQLLDELAIQMCIRDR